MKLLYKRLTFHHSFFIMHSTSKYSQLVLLSNKKSFVNLDLFSDNSSGSFPNIIKLKRK